MRSSTSGETSARRSTVTVPSGATSTADSPGAAPPMVSPRPIRAACRRSELTFRCAGVRCAFSAINASTCRTITGDSSSSGVACGCAPAGLAGSTAASAAPSGRTNLHGSRGKRRLSLPARNDMS